MLLLAGIVLVFVLPSPWNVIAFLVSVPLFLAELGLWHRTVRGRREQVGTETLIGLTARVVTACHPSGQVRLRGETWEALCEQGADTGDEVVVRALDGLTLVVERT